MNTLPKEAINKIMMFLSHPVADIIKQSKLSKIELKFKVMILRKTSKRGDPFFRGRRDRRTNNGHHAKMWINPIIGSNEWIGPLPTNGWFDKSDGMTLEQVDAYRLGYKFEDNLIREEEENRDDDDDDASSQGYDSEYYTEVDNRCYSESDDD